MALYVAETWKIRPVDQKNLENFENPTNGLPSGWLVTRPRELNITSKLQCKDNRLTNLTTNVQNTIWNLIYIKLFHFDVFQTPCINYIYRIYSKTNKCTLVLWTFRPLMWPSSGWSKTLIPLNLHEFLISANFTNNLIVIPVFKKVFVSFVLSDIKSEVKSYLI